MARRARTLAPRPLTPLEDTLGTITATALGQYGTLREGDPRSAADGSITQHIGYRRRIETVGLWTVLDTNYTLRDGNGADSYGAAGILYEELDKLHVRATGTLIYGRQRVEGALVDTLRPRGFLEYSWRATHGSFFILPRLGYDGYYTTLKAVPLAPPDRRHGRQRLPLRARRSCSRRRSSPVGHSFNDISTSARASTADAGAREFSRQGARPGAFIALGNLDINGYVDATYYAATPDLRTTAGTEWTAKRRGDTTALLVGARVRRRGAGRHQAVVNPLKKRRVADFTVYINVLACYRRGLRDVSSLELDFPEQLGGGVPWRCHTLGGGP